MMELASIAVGVGLIGGFTSGLCGVSPGGALVVFSSLLLGTEQHVAQGLSLVAQIPPTGFAGIKQGPFPTRWLVWLAPGFLLGGVAGAVVATHTSTLVLQWSYVGYLVALAGLLLVRSSGERRDGTMVSAAPALLAVGMVAGVSSGYLGIGGGLAIVVGLAGALKVPQHLAQRVSLALSIIPTTIPAAWIYWRAGTLPSWPVLVAVIVGLWVGTDLGARAANRVSPATLRRVLLVMVAAMAAYMAWRALSA
jgi:uncharacterized protein